MLCDRSKAQGQSLSVHYIFITHPLSYSEIEFFAFFSLSNIIFVFFQVITKKAIMPNVFTKIKVPFFYYSSYINCRSMV